MSRTYRRRKGSAKQRAYGSLAEYTVEYIRVPGNTWCTYARVPMDPNTKEYKIKRSKYYRDKTHNFKDPGPSWFRNLFHTRPLRRAFRRELAKWGKNPEYDVNPKPLNYLPYWT